MRIHFADFGDNYFGEEKEYVLDTFDGNGDVVGVHDVQGRVNTVYRNAASDDAGSMQDAVPTGGRDSETDMRIDSGSD